MIIMKMLLLLFSTVLMFSFVACDEEDDFEDLIDEEITEQPAQLDAQQQAQQQAQQAQQQLTPSQPGQPIVEIMQEKGNCYLIYVPQFGEKSDVDENPNRSTFKLFEDNKPLGPSHSKHKDIREKGKGKYSHYQAWIFFSTSDNTDPRTNGRVYKFETK